MDGLICWVRAAISIAESQLRRRLGRIPRALARHVELGAPGYSGKHWPLTEDTPPHCPVSATIRVIISCPLLAEEETGHPTRTTGRQTLRLLSSSPFGPKPLRHSRHAPRRTGSVPAREQPRHGSTDDGSSWRPTPPHWRGSLRLEGEGRETVLATEPGTWSCHESTELPWTLGVTIHWWGTTF